MSMTVKANTVKNYQKGKVPTNLKKVRYDLGYSIYTLAHEMGVSPSTVSYWENGVRTPRRKNMNDLEDFFGMTQRVMFEFLSEEETRVLENRMTEHPITA